MNLVDIIAKNARFHANQSAFVEVKPITGSRKEVSWLQFHEKTNKIAHALLIRESGKGKKSLCWDGILLTGLKHSLGS